MREAEEAIVQAAEIFAMAWMFSRTLTFFEEMTRILVFSEQ